MNITKNKKGFTLIELLAVIVILAIIILIAATNIGALTTTAKKNALAVEGNTLIESAKLAYQTATLNNDIKGPGKYCFQLQYLHDEGFFDKGTTDDYSGSVLIHTSNGIQYDYYFWISNGNIKIDTNGKDKNDGKGAVLGDSGKLAKVEPGKASENCGGLTNSTDPSSIVTVFTK